MTLSRRNFVRQAAFAAFAGASLRGSLAQTPAGLTSISRKNFEALIGQRFSVADGETAAGTITLMAVEDLTPGKPADSMRSKVGRWMPRSSPTQPIDCFALRFEGFGPELEQKTYAVRCARMGGMSVFLSSAKTGGSPLHYSAIFCLLGDEAAA
jgi:hypothetical protein